MLLVTSFEERRSFCQKMPADANAMLVTFFEEHWLTTDHARKSNFTGCRFLPTVGGDEHLMIRGVNRFPGSDCK
jgi:hypothetical protein